MKNKSRFLSICTLVLCAALLGFGIYALKNATLTVGGTIGFTAHDCNILVYGKITGAVTDADDMTGEGKELYLVNYEGSGDFSKTAAFDFTGTKELTFANDLYSYDEALSTAEHAPVIYFNDSGDEAPDIVITLYLKNNSAYPVSVEVGEIATPAGVISSKSDLKYLPNDAEGFSELTITLSLTDNSSEIVTSSENFSMAVHFTKTKEQLSAPTNVVVNSENKTVSFEQVIGATSYEIAYFKEGDTEGEALYTQTTSITNDVPITFECDDGGNFVVKVKAIKQKSGSEISSEYSSESDTSIYFKTTSAKLFTFKQNTDNTNYSITGYTGNPNVETLILPKTFAFDDDGAPKDGIVNNIDGITSETSKSGFKGFLGNVVLLDNIKTIGDYAFAFGYSKGIKGITIPESVTTLGKMSFSANSALTSISIPKSVIKIEANAFAFCSQLKEVHYASTINNWCKIDIAGESANPCATGAALYLDGSLSPITDTDIVIDGVEEIGRYAFAGFKSLQNVTINGANIGNAAFSKCTLQTVTLSGEITTISNSAFSSATIQEIVIPKSVITFGETAFSNVKISKVTYLGSLEDWCNIKFEDYLSNPACTNGKLFVNGTQKITDTLDFSDFETTTKICDNAFSGMYTIATVNIPAKITTFGNHAFYKCTGIQNVNYAGTKEQWCNIDFGNVFSNPCGNANDQGLPNFNINKPALKVNGGEDITEVDFSLFENYTQIKPYVLYNCTTLQSVTIPQGITSIGDFAFCCTTGITAISIPSGVESIGDYAFSGSFISEVTIPESVTTMGMGAFFNCQKLQTATIKEGLTVIPINAFGWCGFLQAIEIPSTVTTVGDSAFNYCYNLTVSFPSGRYVVSIGINNEYFEKAIGLKSNSGY